MAVPARPASGAPIDSAWGGVAHDTAVAQDIQRGQAAIVFPNAPASNTVAVTFPRPFASAPTVVASVGGPTTNGVNTVVGVSSVTAAGFILQSREVREVAINATLECQWIAVGPRA
jgi:hypothetical protein